MQFTIVRADTEQRLEGAKRLFEEYARSLEFDLDFQDFESELAGFPGEYVPPGGTILLAELDRVAVACVALRRIDLETCEMKRLFVPARFQGKGLGRSLAERIIGEARSLGYRRMRLDTVPSMKRAIRLYQALGFREIPAYRHNPIAGARFMELDLSEEVS